MHHTRRYWVVSPNGPLSFPSPPLHEIYLQRRRDPQRPTFHGCQIRRQAPPRLRKITIPRWFDEFFPKLAEPWSLIGLLFTILVPFASQAEGVMHQIVSVVRVVPHLPPSFCILRLFSLRPCSWHTDWSFAASWRLHRALQQQVINLS